MADPMNLTAEERAGHFLRDEGPDGLKLWLQTQLDRITSLTEEDPNFWLMKVRVARLVQEQYASGASIYTLRKKFAERKGASGR